MKFHNKHFLERQSVSTKLSYGLMEKLFESKKIAAFIIAKYEEDKKGVDFFLKWKDSDLSNSRVQFKNRQDNFQDIPVCRYQPFYGTNSEKTSIGRDYRALNNNENDYYFTAVKGNTGVYDKVLVMSSSKLLEYIKQAEKEWFGDKPMWEMYDEIWCNKTTQWNKKLLTASNGVEAWFKRTKSEKCAKINLYVPKKHAEMIYEVGA